MDVNDKHDKREKFGYRIKNLCGRRMGMLQYRKGIIFIFFTVLVLANQYVRAPVQWQHNFMGVTLFFKGVNDEPLFTTDSYINTLQGGEGPTIILLHEIGGDSLSWGKTLPVLSKYFRVVAPDLTGHGKSASNDSKVSFDVLLRDLTLLIDKYSAEPVILVGSSFGGWLATEYAIKNPSMVKELVLISPMGFNNDADWSVLFPRDEDAMRRRMLALSGGTHTDVADFFIRDMLSVYTKTRANDLLEEVKTYPKLNERIELQDVDVSFIWGTEDTLLPFDRYGENIVAQFKSNPSVILLEGCGHAPQLSCPNKLLKTILEEYSLSGKAGKL